MLKAIRDASPTRKTTGGFTLVEMLVVIVVIGVLAAIAVPIFLDQSAKANEAAVKADLANAARMLTPAYGEGASLPTEFTAGQQTQVTGLDGTVYGSLTPNATLRVDTSSGGLCVTGSANGTDWQTAGGTVSQGSCSLVSASASAPGAPFNLSATAGDGQVALVWSVPQDDGGDTVTSYTVEYATSAEGPWTEFETTTDTFSTVTGLANTTGYFFQVTASNRAGTGVAASSTATPVSPATAPTAPTSLTATAGDTQIAMSWSAPGDDGGAAITGYTVQYATNAGGPWTTDSTSLTLSRTITGLTNGTEYFVRVRANNAAGSSAYATDSATPITVATAPTSLTATAGDTEIAVSWSAPSSNGGSAITGYTVQRATNAGGPWTTVATTTSLSRTITGLTNGTEYFVRVRANNAAGSSSWTTSGSVSPISIPSGYTLADNGKYYKYYGSNMTWLTARSTVAADGGWMAAPLNAADNAAVLSVVTSQPSVPDAIHIGLWDAPMEGVWQIYSTGHPGGYSGWLNFAPGQPDNSGGCEHLASMITTPASANQGEWEDVCMSASLPTVGEWTP